MMPKVAQISILRSPLFPAILLGLLFFVFTFQSASAADTIYVTTTGATSVSNCTSWADPCSLQRGISVATAGDEIWVAEGVYMPGNLPHHRFLAKQGVALYGGFAGNETARNQRNWQTNVTVLSGDIDNNDLAKDANGVVTDTANITGTNSRMVVAAVSSSVSSSITDTTILDGFTITAGKGNPFDKGAGFGCGATNGGKCNPHLENIIFIANLSADAGGAMANIGESGGESSPTLVNVAFINNKVISEMPFPGVGRGGAIYNLGSQGGKSSPTLIDVTFTNNSVTSDEMFPFGGGALYNGAEFMGESSPTLINVTFTHNSLTTFIGDGGAIFNEIVLTSTGNITLDHVIFISNTVNNSFAGGQSSGGAIANDIFLTSEFTSSLKNVSFIDNSADNGVGGALANIASDDSNASLTLDNSLFFGNSAGHGGALYNVASFTGTNTVTLQNASMGHNSTSGNGGAIYNVAANATTDDSTINLFNSIVWGNSADLNGNQIYNSRATVALTHSDVQVSIGGGDIHNVNGGNVQEISGNINADPLFINAGTGDLRLQSESPAIDAGSNDDLTLPDIDLDDNPRVVDGDTNGSETVDMGAYEFQVAKYDLTATLAGNGSGQVERSPTGESCDLPCTARYVDATSVTLSPSPATGSTFSGWNGAGCSGSGNCIVTMNADQNVTATFILNSYAITTTIFGSGTVTKTPDQPTYLHGTVVNLIATPSSGYTFAGWSGDCDGTGNCQLTMTSAKNVTAVFEEIAPTNNAPSFTSTPGLTATVGAPYTYTITTTDPDVGDTFTVTALTKPAWLTLTPTGNGSAILAGTPLTDNVGVNSIQLMVQDGANASATQNFSLTVAAISGATGIIQGQVLDEQGNGIADATVTLSDESESVSAALVRTDITDNGGNYRFEDVPPGNYTITVSKAGFVISEPQPVSVVPGQTTPVSDITLQPNKIYMPMVTTD